MKATFMKSLLLCGIISTAAYSAHAQKFGDNLGNHVATKDLKMSGNKLLDVSGLAIGEATITNSSIALKIGANGKAMQVSTVAQNTDIATPENGMIIYNSTDRKFYLHQNNAWVTFAIALSENVNGIEASSTTSGYKLTQVGQELLLKLAPADETNPGIVTTGVQTFAGGKTFKGDMEVKGITTLAGSDGTTPMLNVKNILTAAPSDNISALVVDGTGNIKKLASVFSRLSAQIPANTSASFNAESNIAVAVTLTVTGIKKDDGIVVNFSSDDLAKFNGLTIISAVATADDTVTVVLADLRNPADPSYTVPAIDGAKLNITRYSATIN